MTTGIVNLKLSFDPRRLHRALMLLRHATGSMAINFDSFGRSERYREQLRHDLGREIAEDYPGEWEAFCVTTNEGRCRVISRPRGGWA